MIINSQVLQYFDLGRDAQKQERFWAITIQLRIIFPRIQTVEWDSRLCFLNDFKANDVKGDTKA
jgi:hypothetical protein